MKARLHKLRARNGATIKKPRGQDVEVFGGPKILQAMGDRSMVASIHVLDWRIGADGIFVRGFEETDGGLRAWLSEWWLEVGGTA